MRRVVRLTRLHRSEGEAFLPISNGATVAGTRASKTQTPGVMISKCCGVHALQRCSQTINMKISPIFFIYCCRKFLFCLFSVLLLLSTIVLVLDFFELSRRWLVKSQDVSYKLIFQMLLFKTPVLVERILPFAVLFSAMFSFATLNRHNELIVARAAGISIWKILSPFLAVAVLIGSLQVMVFNPIATETYQRYETLKWKYLKRRPIFAKRMGDGVWLRHKIEDGYYSMHGRRFSFDDMRLHNVMILLRRNDDKFIGRIDAPFAKLVPGYWVLSAPRIWGQTVEFDPRHLDKIETALTPERVRSIFASADATSFWDLPDVISELKSFGLPNREYRLQWHRHLTFPLLLCTLVILAAAFFLRPSRQGGVLLATVATSTIGFIYYLIVRIVGGLGVSAQMPVVLAAWSPTVICLLIVTAILLRIEDG